MACLRRERQKDGKHRRVALQQHIGLRTIQELLQDGCSGCGAVGAKDTVFLHSSYNLQACPQRDVAKDSVQAAVVRFYTEKTLLPYHGGISHARGQDRRRLCRRCDLSSILGSGVRRSSAR